MNEEKLKVGVIFGGRSGEHEVYIRSAASVMAAMDARKYEIVPLGITKDGRWLTEGDPMRILIDQADPGMLGPIPDELKDRGYECGASRFSGGPEVAGALRLPPPEVVQSLDAVFPVLHGTFGEDGTIQGLFEMAGIPYVGCGVMASSVAMDKIIFKHLLRSLRIPSPAFVDLTETAVVDNIPHAAVRTAEQLGLPVFVKPANLGSSVGITKCKNTDELAEGIREAFRFDTRIIVEAAVPNAREIEVSVLGFLDVSASVPGEIRPSREFYDYQAKYLDSGENASGLIIPATLDENRIEWIRSLAVKAFQAVEGAGKARVDFLLDDATGEIFLNEMNTIPGFTSISMYAKLWDASGLEYPELIDRLIDIARERHRIRSAKTAHLPV